MSGNWFYTVSREYVGCECYVQSRVSGQICECSNRGEVPLFVHYLLLIQTRLVHVVIAAIPSYHWRSKCICLIHLEMLEELLGVSLLMQENSIHEVLNL